MYKRIKIKQHDISDCGAACLASVSAFYGLQVPISRIRQYAGTDSKGTNLAGMIDAAEKLGLTAKAVRVKNDFLPQVPLPAIAHLAIKESWYHFVIVYRFDRKTIKVMDPASGRIEKWRREKFEKEFTGVLLLITPSTRFKKGNQQDSVWKRFLILIKPHQSIIVQAVFGAVFYSILGLATSVYVEKLIDYVIPGGNTNLLNILSLGLLVTIIFRLVIGLLKNIFMLRTGQKIDAMLILGYFRHLMKLPQRFFETMRTGEIISRVNDAVKIRAFINNLAVEIMVNLLILIFTFALMLVYSGEMAARMAIIIPAYISIYLLYNRVNRKFLRVTMEQTADVESQLVESINAITTIKRFGCGWRENTKFESRVFPLLNSAYQVNKFSIYAVSANELFSGLFILVLLWSGTYQVFQKNLTPGELMSVYALFGYMLGPLNSLLQSNRFVQDANIAADRLFQILDLEQESDYEDMADPDPAEITHIHLDNISFRYGSGKNIFSNLDLKIEMHKINGLTGDTGSGKSTILSLIQGIYSLNAGRIVFGKYDLCYIKRSALQKLVSAAPQKTDIFNGSVAENIAISDHKVDMSKVIRVCHETGIMDMIEKLPSGLLTQLGENGVKLSGGELQKIAIARVVYSNPEIYLFDEPSSAMDMTSEEKVKSLIVRLKGQGKTIVLVSHRSSTLEICDIIHPISNNLMVESQGKSEKKFSESKAI